MRSSPRSGAVHVAVGFNPRKRTSAYHRYAMSPSPVGVGLDKNPNPLPRDVCRGLISSVFVVDANVHGFRFLDRMNRIYGMWTSPSPRSIPFIFVDPVKDSSAHSLRVGVVEEEEPGIDSEDKAPLAALECGA